MLLLRRLLRSPRAPYATFRRHAVVWPQILAVISIILQPLPLSRAIYIPDGTGNPYWFPLSQEDSEPAEGPNLDEYGESGQPTWLHDFNAALQTGVIVWWGGEHRLVDGQWTDLPGAYHLPCGDSDQDGIPDLLDPYPADPTNNTFWWQGGAFLIADQMTPLAAGYYPGSGADSDGDGIPDGPDPYSDDPANQNSADAFYWGGGDFLIARQWQNWPPGVYHGSSADSDGDGIPDALDPYPGDSDNGNTDYGYYWSGGTFIVDGVSTCLPPAWASMFDGDDDTDGIPNALDKYPTDATNNSFFWEGGSFSFSGIQLTFFPQYYAGAPGDANGNGIPDAVEAYLPDLDSQHWWWPGGTYWINNSQETYDGAWYAGSPIDADGDGIPDKLDPYPNDPLNHCGAPFAGGDFWIDGRLQSLAPSFISFLPDDPNAGDRDGDNLPNFIDPYPDDPTNNSAPWSGGTFLINGVYTYYPPGQHRADAGDADNDGLPDDLDLHADDPTNNSFWWEGGHFLVDDVDTPWTAQYYAGAPADSDHDGIPDSLDKYAVDPDNGNTHSHYWWDGGEFNLDGVIRVWPARYYNGIATDSDGDGIPDSEDPAPNDPSNLNAQWHYWGGGTFYINNIGRAFAACWYQGSCADTDGDTIPDEFDPAPSDPTNGSTAHTLPAHPFYIDGEERTFPAYTYYGPLDADNDGIPDDLDPYPTAPTNNSVHWPGGTFLISGEQTPIPAGYVNTHWNDQDHDRIPDKFDPEPNDPNNNNYFLWPLAPTTFTIAGVPTLFKPHWYLLPAGDRDGDLIPDSAETSSVFIEDPTNGNDSDHDGIPDAVEVYFGLNPYLNTDPPSPYHHDDVAWVTAYWQRLEPEQVDPNRDSDGDGMSDAYELRNQLNRWDATDAWRSPAHDFIFNKEKAGPGFAPTDSSPAVLAYFASILTHAADLHHDWRLSDDENDWDGDGISNRDERLVFDTAPRDIGSRPTTEAIIQALIQGQASVTTRRNLLWLITPGTDVGLDTDHDGVPDWYERLIGTDRTKADSDGDGMPDYWEIQHNFDPNDARDGAWDRDHDGLSNVQEFQRGTKVDDPDTDHDGLKDGWEIKYGFDPFQPGDAGEDNDSDGLTNAQESAAGSDPYLIDTDGDGLTDAEELQRGSDPAKADTDGDGVNDAQDAVPDDPDFVHPYLPVPRFAVIRLNPADGQGLKVNDRAEILTTKGVWRAGQLQQIDAADLNNRGDVAGGGGNSDRPFRLLLNGSRESLPPLADADAGEGPDWHVDLAICYAARIDDNGFASGETQFYLSKTVYTTDPCTGESVEYPIFKEKIVGTRWVSDGTPVPCSANIETSADLVQLGEFQFGSYDGFTFTPSIHLPILGSTSKTVTLSHQTRCPDILQSILTEYFQSNYDWTPPAPPDFDCHGSYLWSRHETFDETQTTKAEQEVGPNGEKETILDPPTLFRDWPIRVLWKNHLPQPLYAGLSDGPTLWANGHRKVLDHGAPALKINEQGQAILDNSGKNFWQNGHLHRLDELAQLEAGETIKPLDISDHHAFILAKIEKAGEPDLPVLLFPIEAETRDRAISGKFYPPAGWEFSVHFENGQKDLGTYKFEGTEAAHVYDAEDAIFSAAEFDAHAAEATPTDPTLTQDVTFIHEPDDSIRFVTVADDLGKFSIALEHAGSELAKLEIDLTADEDFRRVIAAVEGFVAGDAPPEINAWPQSGGSENPPPTPPLLTGSQQQQLLSAAPVPAVAELNAQITAEPTITLADPWLFFWFITRVDDEPIDFDDLDPTAWSDTKRETFFTLLASLDYQYPPQPDDPGTATSANPPPSPDGNSAPGSVIVPAIRTVIELPAEIRNRGLVSKCLLQLLKISNIGSASSEGTIFGMWDGFKSDVDGVVEALKMMPEMMLPALGIYRSAKELYEAIRVINELGWDGIKRSVCDMVEEFIGVQLNRLELLFPDELDDPAYLQAYLVGYVVGCIGEQVAVGILTDGATKSGLVAKALNAGRAAARQTLAKTAAKFGEAGAQLQKAARSLTVDFGRSPRTADELRSCRRSGSLMGAPTGCFAEGTLVAMADGTRRPIESIHAGDQVLSCDPRFPAVLKIEVVRTQIFHPANALVELQWDVNGDGLPDGKIRATPHHPFFTKDHAWREAFRLSRGDRLSTPLGESAVLLTMDETRSLTKTYNLDVSGGNTFFAGSTEAVVLVHNLEGEIYNYGDKVPRDKSQIYKKVGDVYVPQFKASGAKKEWYNPQHHFHYDAWLQELYPAAATAGDRVIYPVIELTFLQHQLAHEAGEEWLYNRFKLRSSEMKGQWKRLTSKEMQNLAEYMLLRANEKIRSTYPGTSEIKDIGRKIHILKNRCSRALNRIKKLHGC